jgi:hypothetical protein
MWDANGQTDGPLSYTKIMFQPDVFSGAFVILLRWGARTRGERIR